MIKSKELADPNSCLNKAADDEPIFVLRAKDPIAARVVRGWVQWAFIEEAHSHEKQMEAFDLANEMNKWREKNVP